MVGMIQDFVSNEFGHFNIITRTIISSVFNVHWIWLIDSSFYLSSWTALGLISFFTIVVIFINKKNKWLELLFFVSTLAGSFLFSKGIRWIFHYMLNKNDTSPDFPNEQSMLVMAVYGFCFLMLIRHKRRYLLSVIVFVIFLLLLVAYFISGIFIHQLKPSDLVAGYVFSAVWLTGMAFSLEMFRLLSIVKENLKEGKLM
jgi:membrane-associated phospholipid phosphatase